jgi:hypothetical protein
MKLSTIVIGSIIFPHFSQTVRSATAEALQDKGLNRANAQFPDPRVCELVSTQNYYELDSEKIRAIF